MQFNTGIYEIRNITSNKRYIGSAMDLNNRFKTHYYNLEKKKHCNRHLQFAWDKYSKDGFEISPLLFCDKENLLFYEQLILDTFWDGLYNLAPTAGSQLGLIPSEETKQKISKAKKGSSVWPNGRVFSEKHREKISEANSGKKHSDNTRKKMSESQRNRKREPLSEETKLKISLSKKGSVPWNKGKTDVYSEETLAKMSQASSGRFFSDEVKQKMSRIRKGRIPWNKGKIDIFSEESLLKISQASKNRTHSEETRQKISSAVKLAHAEGKFGRHVI